jgi:type I restriction enzyme S subunit
MSEWQIDALGSIASIRRGIGYSEATLEENREDGKPYLNMKSFVKDGGYNKKGLKFFSGHFTKSDVTTVNDLLIANTDVTPGGDIIGVPALLPKALASDTVLFSHHVTRLHISAQIETPFLYYLLCTDRYRRSMRKYARGTTVQMLDMAGIKRIPVSYPKSRCVQQQIIAILTTIDTAIEQTEALIEKYQHIKAGLMHDLFTRGVLPTGQLRPPRNEAPELYQETAIGWIPREWQVAGLASMGRAGTSWIRTGPFGSSLKGEHWRVDGHPVITIGALGTGEFINSELLFISSKDASRLVDFQLKENDVVFSRVADVGRSVVLREAQAGWIMSSNLMRIAVNETLLRPDYLQMQLASDSRVKSQIRASVNSGGRDVANSEVLNRLRFAIPEPGEQDRIIAMANQPSQRMRAEQRKVTKLQSQKLGLMQDLLTGKVSVQ